MQKLDAAYEQKRLYEVLLVAAFGQCYPLGVEMLPWHGALRAIVIVLLGPRTYRLEGEIIVGRSLGVDVVPVFVVLIRVVLHAVSYKVVCPTVDVLQTLGIIAFDGVGLGTVEQSLLRLQRHHHRAVISCMSVGIFLLKISGRLRQHELVVGRTVEPIEPEHVLSFHGHLLIGSPRSGKKLLRTPYITVVVEPCAGGIAAEVILVGRVYRHQQKVGSLLCRGILHGPRLHVVCRHAVHGTVVAHHPVRIVAQCERRILDDTVRFLIEQIETRSKRICRFRVEMIARRLVYGITHQTHALLQILLHPFVSLSHGTAVVLGIECCLRFGSVRYARICGAVCLGVVLTEDVGEHEVCKSPA